MSLDLDQLESEAKEEYVIGLDGITRQKKLSLRILILISELRQARERIEKKQIRIEAMSEEMMRVVKKDERLASAEEALKYYSEPDNWQSTTHDSTFDGMPCTDFQSFKSLAVGSHQVAGKIARAHFEKYGEKK